MPGTTKDEPNLVQIRPRGASRQIGEIPYNENYFYLYFYIPFFKQLLHRSDPSPHPILTGDGSNDAASRMYVPFKGFVDMAPQLGGEMPPKPLFWGVNRHFQAKIAK